MSKVGAWKCNACGAVFMEGCQQYDHKSSVDISFTGVNGFYEFEDDMLDTIFNFEDLCLNCRLEFLNIIRNFVDSKEK